MSFFLDVLNLYNKYYVYSDQNRIPGFKTDLASEGSDRIRQLDHIIKKVKKHEAQALHIQKEPIENFRTWIEYILENKLDMSTMTAPENTNMTKEEFDVYSELTFELELYTEHFYYIAFRLRTIINYLPGLKNFEAKGIRDVRNKLIEHPDKDKDSQIFIRSFGFGNLEIGPTIKAIRYSDQTEIFPDKGLYINAMELKNNLRAVLTDFLQLNDILKK